MTTISIDFDIKKPDEIGTEMFFIPTDEVVAYAGRCLSERGMKGVKASKTLIDKKTEKQEVADVNVDKNVDVRSPRMWLSRGLGHLYVLKVLAESSNNPQMLGVVNRVMVDIDQTMKILYEVKKK